MDGGSSRLRAVPPHAETGFPVRKCAVPEDVRQAPGPRTIRRRGCLRTPLARGWIPRRSRFRPEFTRPVYTRCLFCQAPFPENDALEHLPRGRRVAFDAARGRLWMICGGCKRWSLVPLLDRWEALEELERLSADQGRMLSRTDNIALLAAGPLEIVRVGRSGRREEAWWRYGRELRARRKRFKQVSLAGTAVGAAAIGGWLTGGIGLFGAWVLWEHAPKWTTGGARWLRFGSAAWRGRRKCGRCGYLFRVLSYKSRASLRIEAGGPDAPLVVSRACPVCGADGEQGLRLAGSDGERTLRRVLAYHHFKGASEKRITSATRLIEEVGGTDGLSRVLIKEGARLGTLPPTGSIALEIAANEDAERRLLELELAGLEAHWRREEELAAIIDGELTPTPPLEGLRRRIAGLSADR